MVQYLGFLKSHRILFASLWPKLWPVYFLLWNSVYILDLRRFDKYSAICVIFCHPISLKLVIFWNLWWHPKTGHICSRYLRRRPAPRKPKFVFSLPFCNSIIQLFVLACKLWIQSKYCDHKLQLKWDVKAHRVAHHTIQQLEYICKYPSLKIYTNSI